MTNNKLSKKDLVAALTKGRLALTSNPKGKNLLERIDYTLGVNAETPKSVLAADLVPLVQEMYDMLLPKDQATSSKDDFATLMAAAQASKPTTTKVKVEKLAKKEEAPKEGSVLVKAQEVISFPEKVTLSSIGNLTLAKGINNIEDLSKLLESGAQVKFLTYWTKKHLKQNRYDMTGIYREKLTEFEGDFDVLSPLYLVSIKTGIYTISDYTETLFIILDDEIEEVEGIRFLNGIEYQIYVVEEDSKEEPKEEIVEEVPENKSAYEQVVVVEKKEGTLIPPTEEEIKTPVKEKKKIVKK